MARPEDVEGERLMRALRAEGVDTRTVQRSDAPTIRGEGDRKHRIRMPFQDNFISALMDIPYL